MNALMYLLQVNLYLLLFYFLYLVLLRNETFFKMNRFYLVGSALLSLAIPLMKLQWVKDLFVTEKIYDTTQKVSKVIVQATANIPSDHPIIPQHAFTAANSISNFQILGIIYISVTILLLLNFLKNLYFLRRTLSTGSKHQAFSFFKIVSVDQELDNKETIMNHEMVHVRQWHSIDVIFFEIFAAFNWFNPIAFLYKRAIKDIHEFIADETAALTLENKSAYTLLLVSNVFGAKPQHLTNSFFNQSLLKRRIIMLHKTKSRKVAILKYGLSVPLFALMIIISSATIGKSQQVVDVTEALKAKVSLILSAKPAITVASDLKETSSKDDKQIPAAAKLDDTPPLDYKKVDEIAEFPGGVQGLYEWFKAGFIYPQAATDQGMDEHMIAGFIIEKDGSLSNIKIVKGAGFGTPEIAVKLLEKSPKWAPAKLKGMPVRMSYSFPVNLKVPEMHTEASWILKENALPQTGRDTVIAYFANDRTYLKMPSNATYPGGVPAFNKYLSENLKFPEEATENKVTGIVSLSFTVNKDGTIENIAVSRGIGHGCDEEAIRLIKDSGKWEPGKYEDGTLERTGKAVEIIFLSKDSKK